MSTKARISRGYRPIKIRNLLHYLILMLLAIAISLPAAILPQATPVEAYNITSELFDPPNGTITNHNTVGLIFVVFGCADFQIQVDNNSDFSSPILDKSDYWVPYGIAWTDPNGNVRGALRVIIDLGDGKYYWRARGTDYDRWGDEYVFGPWTTVWNFTVDTSTPAMPVLKSPTEGEIVTDTTPTLSWNAVSDITTVSYEWQVSNYYNFSSL